MTKNMNVSKFVLDNGLPVIVVERAAATAAALFASEAGALFDYKNKEGLAHFLEHMVFKGTDQYKTPQDVIEASEGIGGSINAGTDKEIISFEIQVSPEKIEEGLKWLSQITLHATFPQQEFEKERAVVIEEARMYIDHHQQYSYVKALENHFPNTRWGKPTEGYEKTIKNITQQDMQDFYKTHFMPNQSVLVIYGNVKPETIKAGASKFFGNWQPNKSKGSTNSKTQTKPKEAKKESFFVEERKVNQIYLTACTKAVKKTDPNYISSLIAKQVLGGGMGSKLMRNIREKHGLCYYIHASLASYIRTGYSLIMAGLNTDKLDLAGKLIKAEIQDTIKGKINEKELTRAKLLTKTAVLSLFDDPLDASQQIANHFLETGEIELPNQLAEKIHQVTTDNIIKAANRVFDFSSGSVSAVVPKGIKAEGLKQILG